MDGALVWEWVIFPSVCRFISQTKEDLEVPSSGHRRKQEVVRFNRKSSGLRVG